jgi:hypothetical protein
VDLFWVQAVAMVLGLVWVYDWAVGLGWGQALARVGLGLRLRRRVMLQRRF